MTEPQPTKTGPIWECPPELREDLYARYGLTCPPRWGPPRRPYFKTFGPAVCRVMTALGTPPMPWQRYLFDVALEVDPDTNLFAYREVDLSVMRQQGKTEGVKGLQTWRSMAWPRQTIIYTAQTRNDAREKLLKDFWESIKVSPLGSLFRPSLGLGNEEILHLRNVSRWKIMANTKKGGHGSTLDLGVIDEAFAHTDSTNEAAMSPAMLTRAMAQLWVLSAAGTEESTYWNDKREKGRALIERLWRSGLTEWPSTCYLEWYPPEGMARDDPATWWACMPALGYTITEATVKAELERAGSDVGLFDRGMLNRTARYVPPPDENVPLEEWGRALDPESKIDGPLAFAVAVKPNRSASAIAAYGLREDGSGHIELLEYRRGTEWVVARLVELVKRYAPVAIGIDDRGAASAFLPDLTTHGIRKPEKEGEERLGQIVMTNAKDMVDACGQIADDIRHGKVHHRGQPALDAAMRDARTRRLEAAWAWDRKTPSGDISPLEAVTLARFAYISRRHLIRQPSEGVGIW